MSKQGYIKLYRQIADTPIWADSDKLKLWLMCLMKATHDEKTQVVGNQIIELKAGQFITGRSALSDEFNRDVKKDRRVDGLTLFRWLSLFEKMEMLNIKKTNKYSLVTVLNWDKYQGQRTSNEQQLNSKRTSVEQQLNTNKNDKKEKNVKNDNKKTYKGVVDSYTQSAELISALNDFVDMRIKMKGFTVRALELALQKLDKLASDDDMKIAIVNQTIEKSWKGFFEIKQTQSAYTGSAEKQLPEWWDNQDSIETKTDLDEEELERKIEELRNSL